MYGCDTPPVVVDDRPRLDTGMMGAMILGRLRCSSSSTRRRRPRPARWRGGRSCRPARMTWNTWGSSLRSESNFIEHSIGDAHGTMFAVGGPGAFATAERNGLPDRVLRSLTLRARLKTSYAYPKPGFKPDTTLQQRQARFKNRAWIKACPLRREPRARGLACRETTSG